MSDRSQQLRLVVGLGLIGLGVLWLVSTTDIIADDLMGWLWVVAMGVVAGVFVWVYRSTEELGALLGAYISGAIAVIILLGQINLAGPWIGVFVMLAIAAPFFFVWWRDRQQWWALIPAYVMVAISGVILLSETIAGELIGTYVLWAIALPFGVLFLLKPRENWWALIPGGVMFLVGLGLVAGEILTSGAGFAVVVAVALIGGGGLMLYNAMKKSG
ncbi:MAG: hypothetical protein JXB47_14080 [Anaerolineae bacterium]|nr:hypothetical protein [Anaerolineae bacterium]